MISGKNIQVEMHYNSTKTAKQITILSLAALLLAYLMLNTYVPSLTLNIIGSIITSVFIYFNTLRKKDYFSFIMVIYFCSTFPYSPQKGGAFNLISFICIAFYFFSKRKLPLEVSNSDRLASIFIFVFVLSSVLGWLTNYTGQGLDVYYAIFTFSGVILLLIVASGLRLNRERLKVFLQLNLVLIVYSTIASLNTFLNIIPYTPMLPTYGKAGEYYEGGGIIGVSPLYGEHSLILLMLFFSFFILNKSIVPIKKSTLLLGLVISYVNIFLSISRSVFLLSIAGIALVIILQYKLINIRINTIYRQIIFLGLISFFMFFIIKTFKLDYVIGRVQQAENTIDKVGGLTLDRILDGRAINREYAFEQGYMRYYSRKSWLTGYGWGTEKDNRNAFYVDPSIRRGSAHSQMLAILFLFGWIGTVAYWGLLLNIIIKSFKNIGKKQIETQNRMMALFFFIAFSLFVMNEIKADSISVPTYFAVTIIWMGLALSNNNFQRKSIISSVQ